ncbi:MAG: type VI secretion system-associated protein TagF [Paracoccaceae bacterium]
MLPVGIRIGWTGKLPCRGDFVTGGARLPVFSWFDAWAAEGMVAVRDAGGPAADAFLTSDLLRVVAAAGTLGPAPVLAVIGPGMDRAARLYPFMIAAELSDNVHPGETIQTASTWFEEAEEVFLNALAPDFEPDMLSGLIAGLPELSLPSGPGTGMAYGPLGATPVVSTAPPRLTMLFGGATKEQLGPGFAASRFSRP